MREMAQSLARLGLVRIKKGEPLNVRRREKVRRTLAEAAGTLGWAETTAWSKDPVRLATKDVKKIVKRGAKSLCRELDKEIARKKSEGRRLKKLVNQVQALAEDETVEYPAEIVYSATAKSPTSGLVTKTVTLSVEGPEAALKAAAKVERSLPRCEKLRDEMLLELRDTRDRLGGLGRDPSDVVEGWHGLLKDVLVKTQ